MLFIADPTLVDPRLAGKPPSAMPGSAPARVRISARAEVLRWMQQRLHARDATRRLLGWNERQPRPRGCGWVSRRAWRRHSALLCLRAERTAAPGARPW